jgi:large repetitive protein
MSALTHLFSTIATARDGDCDDADINFAPDASELCDSLDSNCNGILDDNPSDGTLYYLEVDGDGYGNFSNSLLACFLPTGYSINPDDCNDAEPLAWTNALEYCDEVDNNCNGVSDKINSEDCTMHYADGYGDASVFQCRCGPSPSFSVTNSSDCYDNNAEAHPGGTFQNVDRGDNSFDYNWDGVQEKQYSSDSSCNFLDCDDGWSGNVPSYGQSEDYEYDCSGAVWICSFDTATYLQGCG